MSPHSIICISCLPFVIHDMMHFEFCLHSVYGNQKMTIFYNQHVKNVATMDHLYSLHLLYSYG